MRGRIQRVWAWLALPWLGLVLAQVWLGAWLLWVLCRSERLIEWPGAFQQATGGQR